MRWIALIACLAAFIGAGVAHADTPAPPSTDDGATTLPPPLPPALTQVPKAKPKPPATFTFVGGGDLALAGGADASLLAGIRRFVQPADLAVANLEGTLATTGKPHCVPSAASGCFVFRASPEWAGVLRGVGWNALNVANNHALDFGTSAQLQTLAALRNARLAYGGLPGQITYMHAGAVKVALIGTAPYRWAQSLLDIAATQQLVRAAAKRAQVVIVYMHAGAEGSDAGHVLNTFENFLGEKRGNSYAFAHAMVNAGADLVFASGPHVLRGMEWYRGRLIAYSLGNLAGVHTLAVGGLVSYSALLRVTLDSRGRFVLGSVVPLRLVRTGTPRFDPSGASLRLIQTLSRQDFGTRGARIAGSGRISPP